ncbi:MAG: histone deacetylase [Polyangiaceae bacterium]
MNLASLRRRGARMGRQLERLLHGPRLAFWFDASYRLPLASVEALTGMEPRRADLVISFLHSLGVLRERDLRKPTRVRFEDLCRVHTTQWLEEIHEPQTLARVFAVDASDVVVGEVLDTLRFACGGTLEAARASLLAHGPTMNLLGGFHHAGPQRGGGFCAVNDIAVAIRALRAEGFDKRVVVLDLDAHPPDGTAECFPRDPSVWIGSLSGADWGPMPGVDETVLPSQCDDSTYLAALAQLLSRMPPAGLCFVIAGGDVLEVDRLGGLSLSVSGAFERDRLVARKLEGTPQVWIPGGGYSNDAWRVLAGTALALLGRPPTHLSADIDPLALSFARISQGLEAERLGADIQLTEADIFADLGARGMQEAKLLGFYTASGLEFALARFGILSHLRRLGYGAFRVVVDGDDRGDRMRVFASSDGAEHLLFETVLEKRMLADRPVLYVHWLTLRNPRGKFSNVRPKLPGQEEPGLGLAQEAGQLLARMAERLGLEGIAFRPAWLHTAYAARHRMRFADAARQGRFQALLRDLSHLPLRDVSMALAEGLVRLNGEPYTWEADEMVRWLDREAMQDDATERAAEAAHFTLESAPSGA